MVESVDTKDLNSFDPNKVVRVQVPLRAQRESSLSTKKAHAGQLLPGVHFSFILSALLGEVVSGNAARESGEDLVVDRVAGIREPGDGEPVIEDHDTASLDGGGRIGEIEHHRIHTDVTNCGHESARLCPEECPTVAQLPREPVRIAYRYHPYA